MALPTSGFFHYPNFYAIRAISRNFKKYFLKRLPIQSRARCRIHFEIWLYFLAYFLTVEFIFSLSYIWVACRVSKLHLELDEWKPFKLDFFSSGFSCHINNSDMVKQQPIQLSSNGWYNIIKTDRRCCRETLLVRNSFKSSIHWLWPNNFKAFGSKCLMFVYGFFLVLVLNNGS